MTKLEALNMLLRAVGNLPVNDYTSTHPDAANARAVIERIRGQEQKKDWWFNVDYNVTYPLNEKSEVEIPSSVKSLVVTGQLGVVLRGGKLYDTYNNTFKFDSSVTVWKVIRVLDWDDMPETMQDYCAYKAAVQFIRDELEDEEKARAFKEEGMTAYNALMEQHLREGDYNMFDPSRVRRARSGNRPYRGRQGVLFS